jgi:hypothetical protein
LYNKSMEIEENKNVISSPEESNDNKIEENNSNIS